MGHYETIRILNGLALNDYILYKFDENKYPGLIHFWLKSLILFYKYPCRKAVLFCGIFIN